jgi:hypothetical protein
MAAEVGATPMSTPPSWRGQRAVSSGEFKAVVAGFEKLLRKGSSSMNARLRAGCQLLDLLYAVQISVVRDERFSELITLLSVAASEEAAAAAQAQSSAPPVPSRRAGKLFRQWLFLHAVSDDPGDLDAGRFRKLLRSWHRYAQARRFAGGSGPVPDMGPDWPATDFESVSRVGPASDEALEPLCRLLRVKLESHAFAGAGYFGYDLLSGLTALWLLPAVVGWFSRLAAVSAGHETLTSDDVIAGLRRAFRTFGVSPVFVRISERLRLRSMARPGIPAMLLASYGP